MAVSQMSAVQCRLAPLIQVIQDCSHLYHYAVKLMFKLHSCESPLQYMGMPCSQPGPGLSLEGWGCMGINLGLSLQPGSILADPIATGLPADTLQGHRDRFHEQFRRYPGLMQGREILSISCASSLSHFSFLPLSSLKNFFKKASDMLYFKRLIQIPRLPEVCDALRTRGFGMCVGSAHSQEVWWCCRGAPKPIGMSL